MKRKTGQGHAGSRHRVGTDETRRSPRRKLLGVAIFAPLLSFAQQQPARTFRIGVLGLNSLSSTPAVYDSFRQGLRELGYVEGKNLELEYRWAEGHSERLPGLAAELVNLRLDAIFTSSPQAVLAAKKATSTLPIVFAGVGDPVALGIVASLARPGGNITGLTNFGRAASNKRLELLKECVPRLSSVAVLLNSLSPGHPILLKETQDAAHALKLTLLALEVRGPDDFDRAFAAAVAGRAQALLTLADPLMNAHAKRIVDFTAERRLPAIFHRSEFVDAGGLMSYAPNLTAEFRRAAGVVGKVLKGVKPADLPVEEPTKLELVVNMKTAKALGITIPQSIMVRADRVIE